MAFKKSSKCESWACVEVDVEPGAAFQRASSCRDADCVEVAGFQKSSRYATSTCVEVAVTSPVLVRDSKLPDTAPLLTFSPQAWGAFTSSLGV